jgi:hypothetical protein
MTMNRFAVVAASLLATFAAQAQIYQWQDQNNRTVMSDRPPVNPVRQPRTINAEAAPADPSVAPAVAPAGATGKTLADRELDFRQRQKDSREAAEKAAQEARTSAKKAENCQAARAAQQILESGERVALRDSQGERYFLDDRQREAELVKVRESVQAHCR